MQREIGLWTRRALLGGFFSASLAGGACVPPTDGNERPRGRPGELHARPSPGRRGEAPTGLLPLDQPAGRGALLYVPSSYVPARAAPLLLMLHGAGGAARHAIDLVRRHADRLGFIALAPSSLAATWDVIARRRYGADVAAIDALLGRLFADYAVDPGRVAVGGFSDGASYALSLGLTNGDLFGRVLAFSPGFAAPARNEGRPRIFVSHGVQDRVLPIDFCSRPLVRRLRRDGYEVEYVEFPGGHTVPPDIARSAFGALAAG
jgi:phospholipase/carboxylesterase